MRAFCFGLPEIFVEMAFDGAVSDVVSVFVPGLVPVLVPVSASVPVGVVVVVVDVEAVVVDDFDPGLFLAVTADGLPDFGVLALAEPVAFCEPLTFGALAVVGAFGPLAGACTLTLGGFGDTRWPAAVAVDTLATDNATRVVTSRRIVI